MLEHLNGSVALLALYARGDWQRNFFTWICFNGVWDLTLFYVVIPHGMRGGVDIYRTLGGFFFFLASPLQRECLRSLSASLSG